MVLLVVTCVFVLFFVYFFQVQWIMLDSFLNVMQSKEEESMIDCPVVSYMVFMGIERRNQHAFEGLDLGIHKLKMALLQSFHISCK